MFGLIDLINLIISAFIILPIVAFMREFAYLIAGQITGTTNSRITIGSGKRMFNFNFLGLGQIDVRRNYHLYSWFSFDNLKRDSKFSYAFLYASPILINVTIGLTLNSLLANGYFQDYSTFFDRLIFYIFFYVLFDAIPMSTLNGRPNNGKIIYDMLVHGKRTDSNKEHFIPSTSETDSEYERLMKDVEKYNNK